MITATCKDDQFVNSPKVITMVTAKNNCRRLSLVRCKNAKKQKIESLPSKNVGTGAGEYLPKLYWGLTSKRNSEVAHKKPEDKCSERAKILTAKSQF